MKTFLEHIERFTPSMFPTAIASQRAGRRIDRLCELLNQYANEETLPNPIYNDIKMLGSTVVEGITEKPEWIYEKVFRGQERGSFTLWDLDNSIVYPHTVEGKLKKLKSAKPQTPQDKIFVEWYTKVLTEALPLALAIVALKDKAVKKQPKTEAQKAEEKQKFIAPLASMESGKAIHDVLMGLTDSLKGEYADQMASWFMQQAQAWVKLSDKEQSENRRYYADVLSLSDAWDISRGGIGGKRYSEYTLKSSAGKAFLKEGKKLAEDMQAAFVYKNKKKLVSILEAKGINLAHDPKVLRSSASRGSFEGEIRIDFQDGSGFTVRNKIVWKTNSYRTVFNQFPTTFHDVVMKDGSKMGAPSEERMNDVFAKG